MTITQDPPPPPLLSLPRNLRGEDPNVIWLIDAEKEIQVYILKAGRVTVER